VRLLEPTRLFSPPVHSLLYLWTSYNIVDRSGAPLLISTFELVLVHSHPGSFPFLISYAAELALACPVIVFFSFEN